MHSCPAHDVIWRRDARVLVFHATRGLDGRGFTSVASAGFVICHPPLLSIGIWHDAGGDPPRVSGTYSLG